MNYKNNCIVLSCGTLNAIVAKVPEFISPIESQKAACHDTAVFSCVVDGKPLPEVKFYKNGVQVPTNDGLPSSLSLSLSPHHTTGIVLKPVFMFVQ